MMCWMMWLCRLICPWRPLQRRFKTAGISRLANSANHTHLIRSALRPLTESPLISFLLCLWSQCAGAWSSCPTSAPCITCVPLVPWCVCSSGMYNVTEMYTSGYTLTCQYTTIHAIGCTHTKTGYMGCGCIRSLVYLVQTDHMLGTSESFVLGFLHLQWPLQSCRRAGE